MRQEFLFVEKYRPRKLDDCILPEILKSKFQAYVSQGDFPNLLLHGTAGTGKTTVARVLCEVLDVDYLFVNASKDGGIGTLRTDISAFASATSLEGNKKAVILDEADYLTQATQPALRSFMEKFSKNCRFILTCNYKNKIIEPLHSRCSVVDFTIEKEDKPEIAKQYYDRLLDILKKEEIECSPKLAQKLIMKYFPDFRRVLNEVQGYISDSKSIDDDILVELSDVKYAELMKALRKKDFTTMRKWVNQNIDNDFNLILRKIYDSLSEHLTPESVPQAVLILHDYLYKSYFVIDPEINLVAALTEFMLHCDFKS